MAVGSFDGMEFDDEFLKQVVSQGSLDFDTWTSLISTIQHLHHDDINKISVVYDSFLSEFPLCYGYWKRYAEHTARLSSVDNVVQIFERAVKSAPYCVGVWVDYCSFAMTSCENPLDVCRLFERGLSFVGKDYLCYTLWDKYIEFEYSHERWNSLASIYIQTLKFPTKKLHQYYKSFKKLVAIWKEDAEVQGNFQKEKEPEGPEHNMDSEIMSFGDGELSHVVNDLINPSTRTKALEKYISVGEFYYQRACGLESKVKMFEQSIHRPYFHVKPLDESQLHNWHRYLDLVEMEGDFDWAVKLYERCLISCAHYPEFWMRYVDYVESKGGREMAFDALERATNIFLKNVAEIHIFSAWFKEKMGDYDGVHAAIVQCDHDFGPSFVDTIRRKANIERRMGNYSTASSIYEEALDLAAEKRPDALPLLYVHFAHFQYLITNSVEATRDILLKAVKRFPYSKLLLKELIRFALMHDGARQVDLLDSIVAQALSPAANVSCSLSTEDRAEISRLYLEFIDCCGSIDDIRRAWNFHLNNFPQFLRVQSSLKKPAKSGAIWDILIEGRSNTLGTHSQKSSKEHDENHMFLLPPSEKQLVAEDTDKSGKPIRKLTHFEDGNRNLNDLELVASEVKETFVEDESKATKSGLDDGNSDEFVKDSKKCGIQEKKEHDRKPQQDKLDSQDALSLHTPDEECDDAIGLLSKPISPSNRSTPAAGHEIDKMSSLQSPVSQRDNKDSPYPTSNVRQKDPSSTLSPDRPSEKEGSQRHFNSYSKGRSRFGSPERQERSLSPRRRNSHGYSDDRRHRERSLSPRRHNSRWHSDDRWHRDGRHRRFSRHQDNPRSFRDGRMQNQNKVGVGNKGVLQQQSAGSSSQAPLLPAQPIAFPQPQTSQFPLPSSDQYGNLQNNQLYSQMWQYYYANQQQHQQQPLLQQPLLGGGPHQQLPLGAGPQAQLPLQQLQQMQTLQQLQQAPQLLQLSHQQQQQFYQQQQFQQPPNEQQQLQLQPQMQLPQQQLYVQLQSQQELQQEQQQVQPQQTQLQQQDEVQQQQQQTYQYQQYLLYLQQLHQYQQSLQQQGLLTTDQKQPEEQQKVLQEIQEDETGSISSPKKQDQGVDHIHGGTAPGVPAQDELPEIEGTDI